MGLIAAIAWPHDARARVKVYLGAAARWEPGLGDAVDAAVERSRNEIELYARLKLALDVLGLEPTIEQAGGATVNVTVRRARED